MLRVRLKADGRLVEILPDGRERAISFSEEPPPARRDNSERFENAVYARNVRGRTGLTQAAFAAQIGVPVETVRNWEQGKRSPRGPARALLKVIDGAPEAAFAVLGGVSLWRFDAARQIVSADIQNVPSVEAITREFPCWGSAPGICADVFVRAWSNKPCGSAIGTSTPPKCTTMNARSAKGCVHRAPSATTSLSPPRSGPRILPRSSSSGLRASVLVGCD